jgi:hypothetical protein
MIDLDQLERLADQKEALQEAIAGALERMDNFEEVSTAEIGELQRRVADWHLESMECCKKMRSQRMT